jgi:farnesyl-diphosphate farnesyltransferase
VPGLEQLLERTSRTFALNIPLLPEPTRRQVTVSYLLFRIADTFEDSVEWPLERRLAALDRFARIIERPRASTVRRLAKIWTRVPPLEHPGYTELLEEAPAVLEAFVSLDPDARKVIGEHVVRTAEGMGTFIARAGGTGDLRLRDLADLREYCYVVAGIVGEMLTALFLLGRPELETVRDDLQDRSADFGEGLQLTNILRDSSSDVGEGRQFLPEGVDRSSVFALARLAVEYTHVLQEAGAARGLVAFNALPVALARSTLARVEREGPGAKLSRDEVARLVATVETALDRGQPALSLSPAEASSFA